MGNTEGGRLSRSIHKQVYFNRTPKVLQQSCTSRTTLSTDITPPDSLRYTANPCPESVIGQDTPRTTYQGGVSQEQIKALLDALAAKKYPTESARIADINCNGYIPAFSQIVPPVPVCPPLSPPPLPPMIPGVNPVQCINTSY